ncbi:MAG: hypothetical protein RLZZ437_1091, partial [Pseudomonadota bacterium]
CQCNSNRILTKFLCSSCAHESSPLLHITLSKERHQTATGPFLAFNRLRGNAAVPAGFLLGFMRRWRTGSLTTSQNPKDGPAELRTHDTKVEELNDLIRVAPSNNRGFHEADLCRLIGRAAYDARVRDVIRQFNCPRFAAILAVHGRAVLAGEISR